MSAIGPSSLNTLTPAGCNRAAHSPGAVFRPSDLLWSTVAALICGAALLHGPMLLLVVTGSLLLLGALGWIRRWSSLYWPGALLVLFIFFMSAFGRDFSYVHTSVGGLPLYVTEICLILLVPAMLYRILTAGVRVDPGVRLPLVMLGLYVLIGLMRLPHDLSRFGLEALRDAVLVYYTVFAILALAFLRTWRHLRCTFAMVWLGSLIASLLILWNALTGQGLETSTVGIVRYGAGIQAVSGAFAVLGGVSLLLAGVIRRYRILVLALLLCQLAVSVFLVQHRSLLLAIVGGFATVLLVHPERGRVKALGLGGFILVAVLGLMLALGLLSPAGTPCLQGTMERAATSVDPMADANTRWRTSFGLELLRRVAEHPLLGYGFGEPISFRFGDLQYVDADPHNSFVAVIYRLGFPAAACLLTAVLLTLRRAAAAIKQLPVTPAALLAGSLASFVALAIFACFNVVLEGPYMGLFFWLLLGVLLRYSTVLRTEGAS